MSYDDDGDDDGLIRPCIQYTAGAWFTGSYNGRCSVRPLRGLYRSCFPDILWNSYSVKTEINHI